MNLERAVTVVTGAASGIGAAAARAFAARGARLVLGDVQEEPLAALADELTGQGAEVAWRLTDVTREADVVALMDLAVERFGGVHAVLPSAGVFRDAFTVRVKEGRVRRTMDTGAFRAVIDVNLTGTFLTVREGLARMVDGGHEGVVFVVSSINKEGELGQLNYASSKAALAMWPKLLAGELHAQGVRGVRVVGVAPGYVDTPILRAMPEERLDGVLQRVPLGRLIHADEITGLLVHVAENDALNATTIEIAGGVLASGLPK
jgi:3-oxoacyl-[acyl-carrier protein] reductase